MLTVLSAMAQQESENISSHVKLGLQMKLKRGELIGYNGCLGYVYDKESKQISVNYEEAEIVRYIFERYCQGVGCTTIACGVCCNIAIKIINTNKKHRLIVFLIL